MSRLKKLFLLFFSMFKVGLFTFGGGYAMISLLEAEFVTRRAWISHDEFMDVVVIAESTPGPIAINCATYIGYKNGGILGSVFATLGMVVPSFTIIYLISLFFNLFMSLSLVAAAFRGIQVCVVFLIFSAGVNMLKKMKKTPFSITVTLVTLLIMTAFALFSVNFSSIFYIVISGSVGALIYTVKYIKDKKAAGKEVEK